MSSGHNIILKYHGNLKNIYVLKNKIKKTLWDEQQKLAPWFLIYGLLVFAF